jgi:hypothetical protein
MHLVPILLSLTRILILLGIIAMNRGIHEELRIHRSTMDIDVICRRFLQERRITIQVAVAVLLIMAEILATTLLHTSNTMVATILVTETFLNLLRALRILQINRPLIAVQDTSLVITAVDLPTVLRLMAILVSPFLELSHLPLIDLSSLGTNRGPRRARFSQCPQPLKLFPSKMGLHWPLPTTRLGNS